MAFAAGLCRPPLEIGVTELLPVIDSTMVTCCRYRRQRLLRFADTDESYRAMPGCDSTFLYESDLF